MGKLAVDHRSQLSCQSFQRRLESSPKSIEVVFRSTSRKGPDLGPSLRWGDVLLGSGTTHSIPSFQRRLESSPKSVEVDQLRNLEVVRDWIPADAGMTPLALSNTRYSVIPAQAGIQPQISRSRSVQQRRASSGRGAGPWDNLASSRSAAGAPQ